MTFLCAFQCILLSTFLAVFIIQCPVANGRIGKVPGKKVTAVKDRVSSAKAFNHSSNNTTLMNRNTVVPSRAQKSIRKANAKAKNVVQNPTTVKRLIKRHSSQSPRSWWRGGVRSGVKQRKYRVRTGGSRKSISVDKQNVTNITALNYTAIQGSIQNKLNLTVLAHGRKHPCNSVNTTAMKFKTGNIECRRLQTTELAQEMNCRGMYNHQYLASSFKEALQFKDLDTGKKLNLTNSFVLHRSSHRRQKKDLDIDPGETLIVKCHATKTPTESGYLRICPSCSAITRQPSTPRRFPEYINELLCDPQMVSSYLPGIDAFCVQKTFTLDLLQSTEDWELNPELSAGAGHDVYTEKWELYTQTIRRHCACELLPSSPMVIHL